jgi:hypothetical protein
MSIDSIYIYGVLEHVPFPRVSIRQYSGDYLYIIIPWLTRFLLFQQGRLITYFPHYPCIRFEP